jgi:hypothetical protein
MTPPPSVTEHTDGGWEGHHTIPYHLIPMSWRAQDDPPQQPMIAVPPKRVSSPIPQHAHRAADAPPDQRAQAPAPEQALEPSAAIVQQSSKTAEKTKLHAQPGARGGARPEEGR